MRNRGTRDSIRHARLHRLREGGERERERERGSVEIPMRSSFLDIAGVIMRGEAEDGPRCSLRGGRAAEVKRDPAPEIVGEIFRAARLLRVCYLRNSALEYLVHVSPRYPRGG